MLSNYVPILGLFALAAGFALFSVTAAPYVGPRRYNRAKLDAYECGIEPVHQPLTGGRFPIKYYLVAMLFIVFDIEIVFLYPWAVAKRTTSGRASSARNPIPNRWCRPYSARSRSG
jgi:NADH-quinone oxidoreductase subunit A